MKNTSKVKVVSIKVKLVVRQAFPSGPGYIIQHGGETFNYCCNYSANSYEELRTELDRVGSLLSVDSRLVGNWSGLEVSAELPTGARKPNGWGANKYSREVFYKVSTLTAGSL